MPYSAPADFSDPSKWDFIATTPKAITLPILNLCSALMGKYGKDEQLDIAPVFVPVQSGLSIEGILNCYRCVKRCLQVRGGRQVHGFLFWELEGIYLNAEHHAIVQNADGTLLDVTPPMAGEKQVLFLPVRFDKAHEGTVQSEFVALSQHPLIQEIIPIKYEMEKLLIQSKAHTSAYRMMDDKVCRNIMRYHKIMQDRAEKNKARERKRKRR